MAEKFIRVVTDDYEMATNGTEVPADVTVPFGVDGHEYEIDVTNKNAARLRADIEKWAKCGRRISKPKPTRNKVVAIKAPASDMSADQKKAIREWARRNMEGRENLADRGRIPQDVMDAFNERFSVRPEFTAPTA